MNNPHQDLFEYCMAEKKRAMKLWETSKDQKTKYNTSNAINAWDELQGQLYKPKPINRKQFEKAKATGLFCAGLMTQCQYKDQTINKIKQLEL